MMHKFSDDSNFLQHFRNGLFERDSYRSPGSADNIPKSNFSISSILKSDADSLPEQEIRSNLDSYYQQYNLLLQKQMALRDMRMKSPMLSGHNGMQEALLPPSLCEHPSWLQSALAPKLPAFHGICGNQMSASYRAFCPPQSSAHAQPHIPYLASRRSESPIPAVLKHRKSRNRSTYTAEQSDRLHRAFAKSKYLFKFERIELAREIGLSETQVKVWFQNKRMKLKKMNRTNSMTQI